MIAARGRAIFSAAVLLAWACGCGNRDRGAPLALPGAEATAASLSASSQKIAEPMARLEPGDHTITIRHDRENRRYLLHVPPRRVDDGSRTPLVVMFHGGGANAGLTQKHYGWDALADSEGFVVAYPDGSGGVLDRVGNTWNAGTCCGAAWEDGSDDLGFFLALLDDLAERHSYDPSRVYAAGHSNGGMMAYHIARHAADRVAAIASVAGCSLDTTSAPSVPVPVLHIHSTDDPRAPWSGGSVRESRRGSDVVHGNLDHSIAWWREINGCDVAPRRRVIGAWRHPDGALHRAEELSWGSGRAGSEVSLIRLTGAGHGWPGAAEILPEKRMGPNTDVIDATEEVWRFLSRFRHQGF